MTDEKKELRPGETSISVEVLFTTIGKLTVEKDLLVGKINQLEEEIKTLRGKKGL